MQGNAAITIKQATARFQEGINCVRRGEYAQAITQYTRALQLVTPVAASVADGLVFQARLYIQRGYTQFLRNDLQAAVADYQHALALAPAMAEVYAYRGMAYMRMHKIDEAIADYDQAILLALSGEAGGHVQRRVVAMTFFNRGNVHYQRRNLVAAETDYCYALTLDTDLVDAQICRGVTRARLGDGEAALADYSAALQHPLLNRQQHAVVLYRRGILHHQQHALDAAIGDFTQALALNPDYAECLFNRGNVYAELGQLDAAIADYQAALARNVRIEDGFRRCGLARLRQGDLPGAIADFTQVLEQYPHTAEVRFYRGCARLRQGDYDGAIADFSAELTLRPLGLRGHTADRAQRSEIYAQRGLAHRNRDDLAAAIDDFDRALAQLQVAGGAATMGAQMAQILLQRGIVYALQAIHQMAYDDQQMLHRRAIDDLEQALHLAPDETFRQMVRRQLEELHQLPAERQVGILGQPPKHGMIPAHR